MPEIFSKEEIDELLNIVEQTEDNKNLVKKLFQRLKELFIELNDFEFIKDDKCEYFRKQIREIMLEIDKNI